MPSRSTALGARDAFVQTFWGAALLAISAALVLAVTAPRLIAELTFGPVCSGHGWMQPHCAACAIAASMAGAGLGLLALGVRAQTLQRRR